MARRSGSRRTAAAALAAGLFVAALSGCSGPDATSAPPSATPRPSPDPVHLVFGVIGPPEEVAVYDQLARDYQPESADVTVDVVSWPDEDTAMRAFRSGESAPDLFLVSQRDLAWFTERDLVRPVDELLDERGVSFGDTYSRDALQAFATDNSLMCMPYSVSPMVVFYNTDLIDFERMRRRGLDAPEQPTGWDFEQFAAAAQFATRPGKGTRGVYIEPTLAGLSPFIYAGGGAVFDDPRTPTSLAFSDGDTRSALETTLTLLRNAQLTPTAQQLADADPVTLFERGRLGMIAGYRSLVPRLRGVPGLRFDVMPIPSISRTATVGDVTGLCLSSGIADVSAAADFLVHVLSDEAVSQVVEAGYTVPSNVAVASSDAFLQPGLQPANAAVFRAGVRHIQIPPLLESWGRLEKQVEAPLLELVTVPVLDEETLTTLTEQIDLDSQQVLAPPEPSPSETPTSPSPS